MILIQDKVVHLDFSFYRRTPRSGSPFPREDVYTGSAPIGYWNTGLVGARYEADDGKPETERARLFVKRGRYTPKSCYHFRNSDITVHVAPTDLFLVNNYPEEIHSGVSSGGWEGTGAHSGESLAGISNLIWFVVNGVLTIVYSYGFTGSVTPGSGYKCWRVFGNYVASTPDVSWWSDGGVRASDTQAMYEWGKSAPVGAAIPLEESPDFTVREVPNSGVDLEYVLNTVGQILEEAFAEVEEKLPLADTLDEALGNYLGPDISWLETLLPLKDTADLAKTMTTVPRTVKELAGYFLAYKYGVAPWPGTIRDIDTMVTRILTETIRKNHPVKLSAGKHVEGDFWTSDIRATVRARVANATVLTAARMGVADPLSELWNCIPYSFAVDWFVDLGGAIGRLEKRAQWASLELSEILTSYKTRIDLSHYDWEFRKLGVAIQGYAVLYRRVYHDALPAQNYFQLPDVAGNIRRHWAEGLALVIQRV